jgi:two-component system phosphate regulon sensor histidine kinase PhoR
MSQKFAEAEIAEARQTGDRGFGIYTSLRRDSDLSVRSGALWRLARLHQSLGKTGNAIEDYRELAEITSIAINSEPADLFARRQICRLLEETGDTTALRRETVSLRADFLAGRWVLDRTGWEQAEADIERWSGRPLGVSEEQRALTEALDWLWLQRQHFVDSEKSVAAEFRRNLFRSNNVSVLLLWRPVALETSALLIPPAVVSRWVSEAMPPERAAFDSLLLTDEAGAIVAGTKPANGSRLVVRFASDTRLPWNVAVKPPSNAASDPDLTARHRLLGVGLAAIAILLGGGGYLSWRTVKRELAVARLQTEFVAAVSHEFRTPLTSLHHVTELLEEDDDLPPARRQTLYSTLGKSTARLRGLVESLLDFARMEDGRKPYDLQPLDPTPLVQRVVAEFQRHTSEETVITPDLPEQNTLLCRADADALGHALWNLLDNAVKYSATPHHVCVSVRRKSGSIAIAVADRGFGIPSVERKIVFSRFVRGSDTQRRGIKGTGLGLAIVSHIVDGHRGRIDLDSEEGRGSTFTILLPEIQG